MSGAVFPTYIDDTQCDKLLVCLVNPSRGRSPSKQRLSYRIMESISLAYGTKGTLFFPQSVKAHCIRGMASSWGLFTGIPVNDVCAAVT